MTCPDDCPCHSDTPAAHAGTPTPAVIPPDGDGQGQVLPGG